MQPRVALITGAGKGIGEAIALAFANAGLPVAVAARTQSDIERVTAAIRSAGGTALPVRCDVTQPDSIAAAIAAIQRELGPITVLVNNAGAAESHKFIGHDDALWHRMIDV